MTNRDERWPDVGASITARIDQLLLTKAEVIRLSGVSDKTLKGYMEGQPVRRVDKKRELSRALGWTDDGIDRLLDGEAPDDVVRPGVIAEIEADPLLNETESAILIRHYEQLVGDRRDR